jgi:3-oxoadipate enol-lactonase
VLTFRSGDAQLAYEVVGEGSPVVLLHPFPLHHQFWMGAATQLSSRYRLIVPDLRAHGDSELGDGPATMQKHADDLARLSREAGLGKAIFVGVSIGGYVLFEFWRRYHHHVIALVLANTRAAAETPEGRAGRLQSAGRVLREGTAWFVDEMAAKLVSSTTRTNRPDIVEEARQMMRKMSPQDIAGVQQGMAERPNSITTLATIDVPTLLLTGEEDVVPRDEVEQMQRQIRGSALQIIPGAGHYAALEKPAEFGRLLRKFLDGLPK